MGKHLKFLISSLILGSLWGIYYFGIPAAINLPARSPQIKEQVKIKTGLDIEIVNPKLKMGILPAVIVDSGEIKVYDKSTTPEIYLKNPHLKLKLLPLVFKKIEISNFSADEFNLKLNMDKNLKFRLGSYLFEMTDSSPLKLSKANVEVKKFNVSLADEILGKEISVKSLDPFKLNYLADKSVHTSLKVDLYSNNVPSLVDIAANLKLPLNQIDADKVYLKGNIKNLNLADFTSYAMYFSKGEVSKLSGVVNFSADTVEKVDGKEIHSNLSVDDLGIFNKDNAKSIFFKDKLSVVSDITPAHNSVELNEIKLKGKGLDVIVDGKIDRVNTKKPYYNINTTINKSRTEAFIPLLPGEENLSPDVNLYLLKKNYFYGDIVGNLHISGDNMTPDVNGNILVTNGYLIKPIVGAKGATIKLGFRKNILDLDVVVPVRNNQTVWVEGPIELYGDKNADLMITSTDNVDLATAQFVLNPLHRILKFPIGPVPVMDIKGKGGIDLRVVGNREKPHGFGYFKFHNGTVSFNDIHNMTIRNAAGELKFNDIDTKFTTKSALLNGKPVTVEGTCNLYGELDFNVKAKNQDLGHLVKILKTSPMIGDVGSMVKPVNFASGPVDLDMNLTGKIPNPDDIVFGKNLFAKGKVALGSNTIGVVNTPAKLSNIKGVVDFENTDASLKLNGNLNKSVISVDGIIKDLKADIGFSSDKLRVADVLLSLPAEYNSENLPYRNDINRITTSFSGRYKGALDVIDLKGISLKGKVYSNKSNDTKLLVGNASYELNNGDFKLNPLRGKLGENPYYIALNVKNILDAKRNVNAQLDFKNLDLAVVNDLVQILPAEVAGVLADCENLKGILNLSARISNNKVRVYTLLDGVSFDYLPQQMHFAVNSGSALLNGNQLNLNKISAKLGGMPIFLNGKVSNVYKNTYLDIYLNAKPSQDFIDRFFNNKQVYPLKMKGDVNLTAKFKGTADMLAVNSQMNIDENSNLYYMGATIGDVENPVKISVDANIYPNKVSINNLKYDKIIDSQNNKPFVTPQLTASGTLTTLKDNVIGFKNFKIKTLATTDAKIFNVVFRKPIMKQGVFTSDLELNGTSVNPKILGKLNITSIDMPFYNSTIRDIDLDMNADKIYVKSRGLILSNEVYLDAVLKNKLIPPYEVENVNLKFATLNINEIADTLKEYEVESVQSPSVLAQTATVLPDLSQVIVREANVLADKIRVKNIDAENFVSKSSMNSDEKMMINVDKFKFDVAEGKVFGETSYNLQSHSASLKAHMDNANAQVMSEALFDLKGQIYGLVTGDVNLSCNAKSDTKCMETLSGDAYFIVQDGKMPKLGSLEYLLKAGNLITGGITGLSINGIIDLITPLKTGEFASISGDVHILDGIAEKINIYSDGKDLNMYMTGSYNLSTAVADMKIFGSLSKNMTNMFSKIKNVSLNTLLNTIPWIGTSDGLASYQTEISKIPSTKNQNNIHRIFMVDVNGDINGDKYVKSFKWIK